MTLETTTPAVETYQLLEFNVRRMSRGAKAARVAILLDGKLDDWLWMSKSDVTANIKELGNCDAFQQALDLYANPKPFKLEKWPESEPLSILNSTINQHA